MYQRKYHGKISLFLLVALLTSILIPSNIYAGPGDKYTVSFNTMGGSVIATYFNVSYDSKIPAPSDPNKTGYTFDGWYKDSDYKHDWNFSYDKVKNNITLYAKWKINTYTVTFVDWNNTVLKTETVEYEASATPPADPTRTGYTFTGWDPEYDEIEGDLTVTAQYEINTYTVTFVDWNNTVLKTETVEYEASATPPADPTRTGYTFDGWDVGYDEIDGDLTVTAQYEINTYTVTFDSTGGDNIDPVDADFDTMISAPASPTRTGYDFKGWYIDRAYTAAWNFDSDKVVDDLTLYARWLKLTFSPNDQPTSVSSTGLSSSVNIPEESDPSYEEINLKLDVEEVDEEDQPNFVITAASELNKQDKELIKAYDLSLIKTLIKTTGDMSTVKVENSDITAPITIRLPLPAAFANRGGLTVVYIDDEGNMTTMATTLIQVGDEYFLEFTTDHFSVYAVVANALATPPVTGETETTAALGFALLAMAGVLYVIRRRITA